MKSPRIRIAWLMGAVAFLAIGFAALRDASEVGAGCVLLLTLSLLTVAILGVAYRREAERAWWLGFALFGWGFAALTLAPWSRPEVLPTGGLLDALYARLSPSRVVAMDSFAAADVEKSGRVVILDRDPPLTPLPTPPLGSDAVIAIGTVDPGAFRSIGHGLLTLLVACVGGMIGRRFHATRGLADPPALRQPEAPR